MDIDTHHAIQTLKDHDYTKINLHEKKCQIDIGDVFNQCLQKKINSGSNLDLSTQLNNHHRLKALILKGMETRNDKLRQIA